MIQDRLDNSTRYHGLHPLFARAFAWAADPANRARADGRYDLAGDDCYAMLQSGQTSPAAERKFESHRRYIDIQLSLAGPEIMEWAPARELTVTDEFKPDNDCRFYANPAVAPTRLLVRPDEFAIFWPEDGHKPCCDPGAEQVGFRKIVFKVAVRA